MDLGKLLAAVSGIAILIAILGLALWSASDATKASSNARPAGQRSTVPMPQTDPRKPAATSATQTEAAPAPAPDATTGALSGQVRPDPRIGPVTHLPIPRFVSLKGSKGNARRGPSLSQRIDWVFTHPGMPLKVTAEYGHWRRVEDADGQGGWIHYMLISGVRHVIVTTDMVALHSRPDAKSGVIARAQQGAIARLGKCTRDWCKITAEGAGGWLPKTDMWGVTANELRD